MTKDIINGIALTSIIVAVSFAVPLIGFFFIMFVPLPTIFFRIKLGRNKAAAIPIAVTVLAAAIAGGFTVDVFFLIALFVLGFTMGELFEIQTSIEKYIGYPSLAVWVVSLIFMFFYSAVSDVDITAAISGYVANNLNHTLTLYREMGMPEETVQMLDRSMPQLEYMLVRIIPGLIMATTLFVAWMNILMARSIFIVRQLPFPEFGPLNRWKSKEILIWGVIAAGGVLLIPDMTIKIFGINALLLFFVIYFFQGMAIVSFFFEKKKLPPMLKVVLYSLIGFQHLLWLVIAGLGFFDTWLDIRKLNAGEKIEE
jgi:uncharacterized protein YybS (DUF2232 family)